MALNVSEPTKEHLQQLDIIKVNHDEAYLYISQGLSYQEQHQYSLAVDMYAKGLEKIDKALSVRCDRPYCLGNKWENARKLQQKMRKTAQTIKAQISDVEHEIDASSTVNTVDIPPQYEDGNPPSTLQSNGTASPTLNGATHPPLSRVTYPSLNGGACGYTAPKPLEQPPSYDEACSHELLSVSRRSSCPITEKENKNGKRQGSTEVVELFSVKDEVLLFYVSEDGSVSTTSTQSSLHVYQFVDHDTAAPGLCPPAWLQIGNWTYPLIPGQSPALESGYGAFLFPNVSEGQGSAVGVVLPPTVDVAERARFLNILNSFTAFKEEKNLIATDITSASHTSGSESYSDTLSRGIVTGAEYLTAGIVKGAHLASNLIHKGATKAKEKIDPEDKPVVVDPRVREGLKIAREASGVVLKATGFLVKRLGDLTLALGRQIAPHVREQGSRLLSSAFKNDQKQANDTIDGVLTVAAGGLQGFSTIYMGLEQAARTLAYSLSSETVNIVDHKYGPEAGEVVGNAVFSIGNLALTTHNVNSLGVKAVAKRTAKDTGKAILKDYVEEKKEEKKPEK